MGHYSEFYEEEERKREKAKRKKDIKTMQEMDAALAAMGGPLWDMSQQGDPIRKHFREIKSHYIRWQYDNGLLVRDPEILIDVLKED